MNLIGDRLGVIYSTLILIFCVGIIDTWRAIPANQALYALRSDDEEGELDEFARVFDDENLPRDTLNSIYKFGWCSRDMVLPTYLKKSANVTFPTFRTTQVNYIYLLLRKNSQQYTHQCVVIKVYVPTKYMFFKGRLPIYYCQGIVYILMMNTINRYELHEIYFRNRLLAPANFVFEFYHGKRF